MNYFISLGQANQKGVINLNLAELKEDFYKRFSSSDQFLIYSRMGMPCSLLGDVETEYCPSLSCCLSMRAQVYGRRLNGDAIRFQSSANNDCIVFHPGDVVKKEYRDLFSTVEKMYNYGVRGADLFADCSVPKRLNPDRVIKAAVFDTLSRLYEIVLPTDLCDKNAKQYEAILSAKKGYAYFRGHNIPLPLTGYKIMIVQGDKQDKFPRARHIKNGFLSLKKLYPHINSLSDVTTELLESSKKAVHDKETLNLLRHFADENGRIKRAAAGLKKCDLEPLFIEINMSEQSQERLCQLEKQHIFIARIALDTDGVLCARVWKNGIFAIVREEKVDYVIRNINYEFEKKEGCQPHICIADTFGD